MVDCPDEARLKSLADSMAEVIRDTSGRVYISQKSSQLYTSTGTASDWYYSSEGNTNNEFRAAAYTIELRDTGQYGFILPPNEASSVVCLVLGCGHGAISNHPKIFMMLSCVVSAT